MHGNPSMQWHKAVQITAHNYNTFPSALNGYSLFLLHLGREDSNPLWNRLNQGNTDFTRGRNSVYSWAAQTVESTRSRYRKKQEQRWQ